MPPRAERSHRGRAAQFDDRRAAGRRLARDLTAYGQSAHAERQDVVVLGLPRGGVPVAYEVAMRLGAPLDLLLVRKLGVPGQEELAFGAIASGGVRVLNPDVIAETQISDESIERITLEQQHELEGRERLYRGDAPPVPLSGRTVLIVDDGLATGATMRAAAEAVRRLGARPVAAVPVAARPTVAVLSLSTDAVVCSITPEPFVAVGRWYREFDPTPDEEVRELLARARER